MAAIINYSEYELDPTVTVDQLTVAAESGIEIFLAAGKCFIFPINGGDLN